MNESLNRLVQTLTAETLIENNISKFTLQNFGGRGKCWPILIEIRNGEQNIFQETTHKPPNADPVLWSVPAK